ncbi:MAG: transglutaminase family protein [Pusillimonas sp.]|nr:transglutaminase family protein [Pusillimonas sp.]
MSVNVVYQVMHDTLYHYQSPVSLSRQILRLTPRQLPWQDVLASHIDIEPQPARIHTMRDAFGNEVLSFCLEQEHTELAFRARSRVQVKPRYLPASSVDLPLEEVSEFYRFKSGRHYSASDFEAIKFLYESAHVRVKRVFADWAREIMFPGQSLCDFIRALQGRIYSDFTFDPAATTVSTPVTEVFGHRKGVCQDFAHLMLSCLRSVGLAARYVSGYILTHPPEGQARLVGADASHAWVSVYLPGFGWVDSDPTNNIFVNTEHITLSWGRDYADISPVRGMMIGSGAHTLDIAVTVYPQDEAKMVNGGYPVNFPGKGQVR